MMISLNKLHKKAKKDLHNQLELPSLSEEEIRSNVNSMSLNTLCKTYNKLQPEYDPLDSEVCEDLGLRVNNIHDILW